MNADNLFVVDPEGGVIQHYVQEEKTSPSATEYQVVSHLNIHRADFVEISDGALVVAHGCDVAICSMAYAIGRDSTGIVGPIHFPNAVKKLSVHESRLAVHCGQSIFSAHKDLGAVVVFPYVPEIVRIATGQLGVGIVCDGKATFRHEKSGMVNQSGDAIHVVNMLVQGSSVFMTSADEIYVADSDLKIVNVIDHRLGGVPKIVPVKTGFIFASVPGAGGKLFEGDGENFAEIGCAPHESIEAVHVTTFPKGDSFFVLHRSSEDKFTVYEYLRSYHKRSTSRDDEKEVFDVKMAGISERDQSPGPSMSHENPRSGFDDMARILPSRSRSSVVLDPSQEENWFGAESCAVTGSYHTDQPSSFSLHPPSQTFHHSSAPPVHVDGNRIADIINEWGWNSKAVAGDLTTVAGDLTREVTGMMNTVANLQSGAVSELLGHTDQNNASHRG